MSEDYEKYLAIRGAEHIAASDMYFDARPQIDSGDRRKVFEAGFERAYDLREAELTTLRNQVAGLQGKLDEIAKQEPVCWLEADPSAVNESAHNVFGSMMYSTNICATKPDRGNPSWPLYAIPPAPPARYRFVARIVHGNIYWDCHPKPEGVDLFVKA